MKRSLRLFERARLRWDDAAAPDSTATRSDREARLERALAEAVLECCDDPDAMAALAAIELQLADMSDEGRGRELLSILARLEQLEGRQTLAESLRAILTADE